MNKYRVTFFGRQTGAIGIFYDIADTYRAKDIHECLSLLHEDYEHIRSLVIKKSGQIVEIPDKIEWVSVRSNRERERKAKGGYIKTRSDTSVLDQ